MERIAITTLARGSWKYQNAYGIARYRAHKTKAGHYVWKQETCSRKHSEPQLRRMGYDTTRIGGLNNVRLTPAEQAFAVFCEAGLV